MWIICVEYPEKIVSIPDKLQNNAVVIIDKKSRQDCWSLNVQFLKSSHSPRTSRKLPFNLKFPCVSE